MPKMRRSDSEARDAARHGPDFVESLERGLRVIAQFGKAGRPMTLSDIAKLADLPRATARRILFTLEALGFVAIDGKLFTLTPRVLTLASAWLSANQIVVVLQPALDRLSTEAREVCSAALLDGDEVVFIARASPARVFSVGIDIGYRLPAFCTSVGRVLLGGLRDADLTAAITRLAPIAVTAHTITDKPTLLAAIITDRRNGYALVDREAEPGFRSISVPVRRYDGIVIAAINIGAHVDRIPTGEMIDRFLPLLQATAASVQPMLM